MTTVFIISAPSGSGKSTLVDRLLKADARLVFSISHTTRERRGAEADGQNYHFISREEFERRLSADEFLESAQVFGNYYGTHRRYLDQARRTGHDLVLDIDVQGERQLKEKIPDAVSIFVLAPSRVILESRLRARSEGSDQVIERRLREAAEEIRNYHRYDYVLVNQDVEDSVRQLRAIVEAERIRRIRMEEKIRPILSSFGMDLDKR
ncbi:MAG: guanylate kinase [Acidobacteriia bacterium]|nr:guanylate kinase [Terriglobia bacterium]